MRAYHVFIKGMKEQIRDYWILVMILVMAPLFIGIYFLMSDPEERAYRVIVVNGDSGSDHLGDSLLAYLTDHAERTGLEGLRFLMEAERKASVEKLEKAQAEAALVIPDGFSAALGDTAIPGQATLELIGDVTRMEYLIGAVFTEELVHAFVRERTGTTPRVDWKETTLGFSGKRTEFELYVPGLLILSIIMIIFSASSAIVREPETRTLERLKVSRLTSLEFLSGISLVQLIIALLSFGLALLTAFALGYTLVPGTLWFLLGLCFLMTVSMISFSLIVAALCRSVKEVAIIGTFPLFLLMFFTGAAFPISGSELFTLGGYPVRLNHILSPTWAVDALHKVLVTGLEPRETLPDMAAILILSGVYAWAGAWAFRRRHMGAA